jgi:hypothetical protein
MLLDVKNKTPALNARAGGDGPCSGSVYWLLNDGVRHSVDHRERLTALNVDEVSFWTYSNTSWPSRDGNGRGNNVVEPLITDTVLSRQFVT